MEGLYPFALFTNVVLAITRFIFRVMWTFELARHLDNAPWPMTKQGLIEYAELHGAPIEVIDNLSELEEEEGKFYHGMDDVWPDHPDESEYHFNKDEYEL